MYCFLVFFLGLPPHVIACVWLWAYDFSESDVPGICDIDLLRNNVEKTISEF